MTLISLSPTSGGTCNYRMDFFPEAVDYCHSMHNSLGDFSWIMQCDVDALGPNAAWFLYFHDSGVCDNIDKDTFMNDGRIWYELSCGSTLNNCGLYHVERILYENDDCTGDILSRWEYIITDAPDGECIPWDVFIYDVIWEINDEFIKETWYQSFGGDCTADVVYTNTEYTDTCNEYGFYLVINPIEQQTSHG